MKINKKRPGLAHLKKKLRSVRSCRRAASRWPSTRPLCTNHPDLTKTVKLSFCKMLYKIIQNFDTIFEAWWLISSLNYIGVNLRTYLPTHLPTSVRIAVTAKKFFCQKLELLFKQNYLKDIKKKICIFEAVEKLSP